MLDADAFAEIWSTLTRHKLRTFLTALSVAWGVFVLINLLPPLLAGGLLSTGRLTATLFPLFLALAAVVPPRAVPGWAALFGIGQGFCAALFFSWRALF